MVVCHCKAVSDSTVRRLVRNGASTAEQVGVCCGAGTDCGSCVRTVEMIIRTERADRCQPAAPLAPFGSPTRFPALG